MIESFFNVFVSSQAVNSAKIVDTIVSGWKTGAKANDILNNLKSMGLGYRRQDFLDDWRRAGHIARVKPGNVLGQQKALSYYNKILEPYRKAEGLTYKQALKNLHKWEHNREALVEKADKLAKQALTYGFDTSP